MKALLGKKIGMSRVFSPTGEVIPVTLVLAEPNFITLRRQEAKDGYTAIQLGLPKKQVERDGQKYTTWAARHEFSIDVNAETKTLTVEQFTPGDVVEVSGVSKGKGFQGVVKRHKFAGGPASHGHRHVLRAGGSIGSRFPQHVRKGKRMAGRMGADRVTVKNLSIVAVDAGKNLLAIKGAVPGVRGSVVEIRSM